MDSSLTSPVTDRPLADDATALPEAAPRSVGRLVSASAPLRVLLAEDSLVVQRRLVALIDALGRPIRVTPVANGLEAAQLFDKVQPDVAVLDIALPGMTGFDLLASFKLKRPTCLVIILTTYDFPEFRANALRMGADYFFSKVLEFERVGEVLVDLTRTPGPDEAGGGS